METTPRSMPRQGRTLSLVCGIVVVGVVVEMIVFHRTHHDALFPVMAVVGVMSIVLSLLGYLLIRRDARHSSAAMNRDERDTGEASA